MRAARAGLAVTLTLGLVVSARQAGAQEANDKAAADVLFEQGRDLLKKDMVAQACPKLEESLRLDRGIGTMLYLAECWKRAGKTASAWAQFREAEDLAQKEHDSREKIAHDNAEQLVPTLSKLTIVIASPPPPGLSVMRDEHQVGQPLWGTEVPVDPGEHRISATAPGYKAWETKVVVAATNDHSVVKIPVLEKVIVPVTPPTTEPSHGEQSSSGTGQRVVGMTLAAVGLAGIGLGAAYGLSAVAKNGRADDHCMTAGCDPDGLSLGEAANSDGTISTIAFAAGAALVVGGAILFFTAPRSRSTATRTYTNGRADAKATTPSWPTTIRW